MDITFRSENDETGENGEKVSISPLYSILELAKCDVECLVNFTNRIQL